MDDSQQNPNTKKTTVRKARRIESVMNSAMWHLTQRDMTESELTAKLKVKTDNQDWIDETLRNLKGYGYLKSDQDFAEQFVEQAFFGEFGSRYIIEKLKKKGLTDSVISDAIHKVSADKNIDEQMLLIDRINHYYSGFTMSREKLVATLQKRGFSYQQVKVAIDQHPQAHELKTNIQIKAEKADLEKEVLKYARKGKGLTAIQQELKQRQIDTSELSALIDRLINEEQLDFYSSCLEQLQKKSYDLNDHKERSKAYAMLSRKGFSSDEIKFALSEGNE
ncbi:Recombinase A [Vibrio chagasii]|uniref:RecX family transcriptional regulator n=1 Tax=Vibrio chagasii TaxID=170679 RepID=UPI001EFE8B5F|nr:RecX family transcriptional regulator [Vibrio chagasii]MCG9560426.1 RecX family transcriptional regulator [Vibrio chagasii]MCG9673347.1 RecX family transcriptional regulator [Vibrio chagasii]CAH6799810.1 Regulatory protein RecX [Vibrio chagasii]CAH6811241.1 Regulatory protein RecX [Vibrio chagasii]CAH6832577.1 Regulatory protein RecX [Vibrio chagasii]